LDATKTTLISSCTILAGESTLLSSCTAVDLSRTVRCIFVADGTFNASTDDGITIHFYPSDDNSTYDDKYWYKEDIKHCVQVGYDAGTSEWILAESVGATSGGSATICGWTISGGTFAGNDAVGNIYLEDVSGTFANDDALTGSVGGAATENGAITNHAFQRHLYPTAPMPLYLKARVTNNGSESVTGFSLAVTTMDV